MLRFQVIVLCSIFLITRHRILLLNFQEHHSLQARIQTGLSGLYKPVRFFRDGSTLNNSHNIFILNLNQFYCLSFFR